MRSAFIFLLAVSAVILFIVGLNLIVVPLVLGPASSTFSCDDSKLVRGMSRNELKIVCGNRGSTMADMSMILGNNGFSQMVLTSISATD